MCRKDGFTLVEIMIVVAIIGLLGSIAIPNYLQARETSKGTLCASNLEKIDGAKQQWAFAVNAGDLDEPSMDDIKIYITNEMANPIVCPSGGTYTVGNMSTVPTCSLADGKGNHELR